jgi:2-polyprenyl-3-methyl-5-hydroxy-6-metoxy-1,4-benzoquinol methylase
MSNTTDVLWRRLGYMLTPQLDIYRHLADRLEGCKVLDVGFGTGFGTLQLARTAKEVIGVEIDCDAIAFADSSIPGIDFCYGDISRGVSFLGNGFDAVVMIEVLEHIENWQAALANVDKMLTPGGALYISARNANAELRKNDLHEREWTAQELVASLEKYFCNVQLYDYSLTNLVPVATRQTPLMAIARKDHHGTDTKRQEEETDADA